MDPDLGNPQSHRGAVEPATDGRFPLSRLPAELRLKIWGMALPFQDDDLPHVIHIESWVSKSKGGEIGIGLKVARNPHSSFTDTESKYRSAPVKSDLGMLGACKESNEVFEKAFPNTLKLSLKEIDRYGKGGILHYGDDTIIYIINFRYLGMNSDLAVTMQQNPYPPFNIFSIRRLAFSRNDLVKWGVSKEWQMSFSTPPVAYNPTIPRFLNAFTNLQFIRVALEEVKPIPWLTEVYRQYVNKFNQDRTHHNDQYTYPPVELFQFMFSEPVPDIEDEN